MPHQTTHLSFKKNFYGKFFSLKHVRESFISCKLKPILEFIFLSMQGCKKLSLVVYN